MRRVNTRLARFSAGCYAIGMTASGRLCARELAVRLLACTALAACDGTTSEHAGNDVDGASGGAGTAALDPAAKSPCPSEVNALLDQVGALVVADRLQCGLTDGALTEQVQKLFDCFAAAPADLGAEFTVNNCIDCSIPTTYVSTPTPEYFAILLENDQYGDAFREAHVARCSAVEFSAIGVGCVDRQELFSCREPRH